MIRTRMTSNNDGSITITVGRTKTRLETAKEADAFICGVKAAHSQIAEQIAPILKIKDGRYVE